MFDWSQVAAAAVTLFLIMDPLGNMPIFNAVLARYDTRSRMRIVARELVFALVILLGFLFVGARLLKLFGLTQPALYLSGGILLFIIALRMIFPRGGSAGNATVEDPFIVPLAMPLVAGPSTIAILLLLSSGQPERIWQWCVALVIAWSGTTILLLLSPLLVRALDDRGIRALERLMGMILVLIATQMLLNGVREFLAGLIATGS